MRWSHFRLAILITLGMGGVILFIVFDYVLLKESVSFVASITGTSIKLPPHTIKQELRFHNYEVPNIKDKYVCKGFTLNPSTPSHIIAFKPVVTDILVHHIILFRVEEPVSEEYHYCQHSNRGRTYLLGWARNAPDPILLPEEAGYLIGEPPSAKSYYELEIHYYNPHREGGHRDGSGFDVYYTSDLRSRHASVIQLGDVNKTKTGIRIPPGIQEYTLQFTCSASSTLAMLKEPIHAIGVGLHGHELLKKIKTELVRDGKVIATLGKDDAYDLRAQRFIPVSATIFPGDELITTCVYDSTGKTTFTYGGFFGENEMCMNFLMYWPAIPYSICAE